MRHNPVRMLLPLFLLLASQSTLAQETSTSELGTLIRQLHSSDDITRARALCTIGDRSEWASDSMDTLVDLLQDAAPVPFDVCDGIGRRSSGNRLGCYRNPAGCPDRTIGELAAFALVEIGRAATTPLENHLGSNSGWARKNATWALGAIGSSSSVDPLSELSNDEFTPVRANVAWALGAIGSKNGVRAVTGMIDDDASEVRENAAWALGAIGSRDGVKALIPALTDDETQVSRNAVWALGAIGDRSAVEFLLPLLEAPSAEIREQAAWAIGAIGDDSALDALLKLMEDEDVEVRRMAVWAIRAVS